MNRKNGLAAIRLTLSTPSKSWLSLVSVVAALAPIHALAQEDAAALAKAAQNPIADMISLPLQYNANFKTGPLEKTQSVLNIQPVYPISLNSLVKIEESTVGGRAI